jgi:DNA-binding PucR family transcriptional regulator
MADATWQDVLTAALSEQGAEGLADLALAALDRAMPVLSEDEDLRDLARASSMANVLLVADIARGAAELRDAVPPPQAVAFARELARRNVPMTELARAYRVVQHAMWRMGVVELRRRIADPADVAAAIERLTDATFATGEMLMSTALERYTEERDRWVRTADAVRRETVQSILDGRTVDATAASARLRYDLRRAHVAFLVWAGDGEAAEPEAAATALGGPGALIVALRAGVAAGWCAPDALSLDAIGDLGAHVAIGGPADGVDGFRRSHAEAGEARRVARLGTPGGAVRYADVALAALLTKDLAQAQAFADHELGALRAADAATRRIADTVLALLEAQGSPRRAAQRLGVHENTVAKRVKAAESLLGHPVDERPAELMAALLVDRLTRRTA